MAAIIKRTYKQTLPSGKVVTRKCKHWTIQFRNAAGKLERIKGYTDLASTKQKAAKLELALARGETGLVDEFKEHKAREILQHLKEYVADLRATGHDDKYTYNSDNRLKIIIEGCQWDSLADVDANSFIRWRETIRASAPVRRGLKGTLAARTLNQYLDTARAFLNWCATMKRIEGVPFQKRIISLLLAGVSGVEGEAKRKRRGLTDQEAANVLAKAPQERRLVYRVGLAIGLRRSELEQLQWGDVRLSAIKPYVQLRAEATKARRGDRLDLPATLADDLRQHRPASATDSAKVFPLVPPIEDWKADLAAAGIAYKDATGRQADFHAGTRKTLCNRLHRSGVPLAAAMRVMRHTDAKLTMVDYADDEQLGSITLPELPVIAAPMPVSAATGA